MNSILARGNEDICMQQFIMPSKLTDFENKIEIYYIYNLVHFKQFITSEEAKYFIHNV